MTIGVFARKTRLSYKALRLYDSMGLLPPAFVDPDSGYRYYTEEQVDRARLIGLLRRLEMPLDRIAEVLGFEGSRAARSVAAYWREVEADARTKRRLVLYLERYLERKGEAMYDVETRTVAEQKVATVRGRVHARELPAFIGETMGRVLEYLAQAGIRPSAPPFVAYHGQVDLDSDGPVEVCVPFVGSLEPKGEVAIRLEPAHDEAYARITKAQVEFPGILEAYDAVARHLEEAGRSHGSPREVYFAEWDDIGEDDPACDVAFPYSE